MTTRRRIPLLLGLALALALACAKRPVRTALEADDRQGEVGYRFLIDARAGSILPAGQELASPSAKSELALPVYPQAALEGHAGPATVAVRIVIGTGGAVVRVLDSPKQASTPGPFAAEFRRAVEDAVRLWQFSAGELRTFEAGEDFDGDGVSDYRKMVSSQVVDVLYDVAFDFRVVDGKGQVSPSP